MHRQAEFLGFGAAFLLVACGGGSSPPAPNRSPPPPTPPAITGPAAALPAATAGSVAPGATITATGATPITFTVSAGSLPAGMTLDANTGTLGGTPLVLGTFDFTVTATNAAGTASAAFSQVVNPAAPNANLGESISTAYAVSYIGDELCRLAPGSPGTLVGCLPLLMPGAVIPLALGSAVGFDIPAEVRAPAGGEAVTGGIGYMAALSPSFGAAHLFEVNLATGGLIDRGLIGDGSSTPRGLAVGLTTVR